MAERSGQNGPNQRRTPLFLVQTEWKGQSFASDLGAVSAPDMAQRAGRPMCTDTPQAIA